MTMIWVKDKPKIDKAWYWWRPEGGANDDAKAVFVRFESSDFQMVEGEWSHKPIPFPDECLFEVANLGPQIDARAIGYKPKGVKHTESLSRIRLECTPDNPYTEQRDKKQPEAYWVHSEAHEIGNCDETRRMKCDTCGVCWTD